MTAMGPIRIEDDSDETVASFVERLARSGSEEQGIYRESEIDAIFNIVALRLHDLAPAADTASVAEAERGLNLVRQAHDLVHEGENEQAGRILLEWLELRVAAATQHV